MDRIVAARRTTTDTFDVLTRSEHSLVVRAGATTSADPGPAPMELMLVSLATCAAATIDSVLTKMRLPVAGLLVTVDAERATQTPRVWTAIRLRYLARGDIDPGRLDHAAALAERTCSASAMLARATDLSHETVLVRRVEEKTTVPLRHAVLRAGMPLESVATPGDDAAVWFGALRDGEVIGTAGLFAEESPDGESAWRLRAMAVEPDYRGAGLGRMLVEAVTDEARRRGAGSLWCSARVTATGFWERLGFVERSEVYEVEGLGPHVRMMLEL